MNFMIQPRLQLDVKTGRKSVTWHQNIIRSQIVIISYARFTDYSPSWNSYRFKKMSKSIWYFLSHFKHFILYYCRVVKSTFKISQFCWRIKLGLESCVIQIKTTNHTIKIAISILFICFMSPQRLDCDFVNSFVNETLLNVDRLAKCLKCGGWPPENVQFLSALSFIQTHSGIGVGWKNENNIPMNGFINFFFLNY